MNGYEHIRVKQADGTQVEIYRNLEKGKWEFYGTSKTDASAEDFYNQLSPEVKESISKITPDDLKSGKRIEVGKTIDKQLDVNDDLNSLDVENVYHVKSDQFVQNVIDEINPEFFQQTNRYGGGFYIAERGETAIAEVVHHGGDMGASKIIRFELDRSKLKILDMTDLAVQRQWNFEEALRFEKQMVDQGLSELKYQKFQEIGKAAREQGFNAIYFNSMRGEGNNFVLFGIDKSFFKEVLKPQMVMPAIK